MKQFALGLALITIAGAAQATGAIYRCGGRTYSQVPCSDGKLVEAADPRTAAQRAEAKRAQAVERKAAQTMERDRKAQAKTGPVVGTLGAAAPASSAGRGTKATRAKGKAKAEKPFTAVAPTTKKAPSAKE
jgi:hypothetical protein